MANSNDTRLYKLDTNDIIFRTPVLITKVVLFSNAAADVCEFKWWDPTNPAVTDQGTATITSTTTITFTTSVVPSTVLDGSVFDIVGSTGAVANLGTELVTTAGNNTVVVCSQAVWTNEATILYSFKNYPVYTAIYLKAGASDASPTTLDFSSERGGGRWFPNLTLETLSTSATVHLYIG